MEKRRLDGDSVTGDHEQTHLQESLLLSISRATKALRHASDCKNSNCKFYSCKKMKRILQHFKNCKRKVKRECPTCKQFLILCCFHGRSCREVGCPIYLCASVKRYVRKRQLRKGAEESQLLQRRIVDLLNHGMFGPVLQESSGNVASSSSSRHAENPQPHQNIQPLPNSQPSPFQRSQFMAGTNTMSISTGNSRRRLIQIMPNSALSTVDMDRLTGAWKQIIQLLKSPSSGQQKLKILTILRANPELMTTFIALRQAELRLRHLEHQ